MESKKNTHTHIEWGRIFLFDVTTVRHLLERGYESKTNGTELNRMEQQKKGDIKKNEQRVQKLLMATL